MFSIRSNNKLCFLLFNGLLLFSIFPLQWYFQKQFLYILDYIILNKKGQKSVDCHSNLYLCIQQPFSELIVFYSLLIHYNRRWWTCMIILIYRAIRLILFLSLLFFIMYSSLHSYEEMIDLYASYEGVEWAIPCSLCRLFPSNWSDVFSLFLYYL